MTFESETFPKNLKDAVIVLLYTGKGDKDECKNYREISPLNVVGKI